MTSHKIKINSATRALVDWFESQEIDPAHAGLIMADLISADIAACHDQNGGGEEGLRIYIGMLCEMYKNKVGAFKK